MDLGAPLWLVWGISATTILLAALLSIVIRLPVYGVNRTMLPAFIKGGVLPVLGTLVLVLIARYLGRVGMVAAMVFLGVPAINSIGVLLRTWRDHHVHRAEILAQLDRDEAELELVSQEWRSRYELADDANTKYT